MCPRLESLQGVRWLCLRDTIKKNVACGFSVSRVGRVYVSRFVSCSFFFQYSYCVIISRQVLIDVISATRHLAIIARPQSKGAERHSVLSAGAIAPHGGLHNSQHAFFRGTRMQRVIGSGCCCQLAGLPGTCHKGKQSYHKMHECIL